ncbi:MAG TPA: hypothetical protein VGC89_07240 [Pyrinomonadaceae bacterium]|jgi:hypothetical protein
MNETDPVEVLIKLLLVCFGLSIGVCLACWPKQVDRKFQRWRGRAAKPGEADLTAAHRQHQAVMLSIIRQLGIFLAGLSLYAVYFWLRRR